MTRVPSLAERLSLIVITDPDARVGALPAVRAALSAGAPSIQLRWKGGRSREMLDLAREIRRETAAAGALFFVNDRLDIALASGADGVHLGDDDLPVAVVRRIALSPFLVGRSVDTPAQAAAARAEGADYVGAGPIFATASKGDTGPVLGGECLEAFRTAAGIPLVAIGGITAETAGNVVRSGADGVAVIGAVMFVDDPALATAAILDEIGAASRLRRAL